MTTYYDSTFVPWVLRPRGKPERSYARCWREVEGWNKERGDLEDSKDGCFGYRLPPRRRVLCLPDWLNPEVPVKWLADYLDLIGRTQNLDHLILTKRPEQVGPRLNEAAACQALRSPPLAALWLSDSPPINVWLGVSVEDQERWDERVPVLLSIPARVRFVSVEPVLGPVNILSGKPSGVPIWWQGKLNPASQIDWIIFGGESGPKARPCDVDWIRDGLRQCREAGVPAYVKQLGAKPWDIPSLGAGPLEWRKIGRIKHSKGGDPAEWPDDLRVREFPAVKS